MTELTLATPPAEQATQLAAAPPCEECAGTGGWFRYDPRVESDAGMLYLSCVGCRGSGRTAQPQG
jgi:hypothetical protein